MTFSREILGWYRRNKRSLPWRNTRDPYKIWLSEIMLQQTRVAQGLPYYQKFVERFPKVEDLANASEEEVLKLWQGLGYYSRARNLHAAAKTVAYGHQGRFPDTYDGLLKLPGVGDYTASAIASICFDRPEPVVDGNVYRVLSRFFGVTQPINATGGVKYFKTLAREVMDGDHIRDYNQGIMEFGAVQCTPKSPDCGVCPLRSGCVALQKNTIDSLPVKLAKTKVKTLYFNYLVPVSPEGKTWLRQRTGKGIWRNLWEFPLVETPKEALIDEVRGGLADFPQLGNAVNVYRYNENPIVHKLSHRHLHTVFWVVETHDGFEGGVSFDEADKYPVPVLIAEFLKTFKNSYF
ncbi:A/G-specific adenine glycosylase [Pseudozobellia thermophila]|uniref:Adenine DNA glycosylase n=1 Tax=Pseudozobellia thermophila TaxID=192903 RepID=A0A1M6AMI6_9FLAO|nr:A/G-specific adenine glycosylase [Pseudozobellia thermophila]SHI37719.1 A/G-specific DNA-adenine glycosylase [Pseudozobellia thermophila]